MAPQRHVRARALFQGSNNDDVKDACLTITVKNPSLQLRCMAFDWSQVYLGNTLLQYAYFFGIIAGAVIVGKLITWISKNVIRAFADKTETKLDDIIAELFEGPVIFTIFIVTFHFARQVLTLSDTISNGFDKLIAILIILNAAWYLIRFLDSLLVYYIQPLAEKTETDLDDHLLPLLKRIVKIVVIAIALVMMVDRLGYNISTLVAGIGIGGLAFALAAQDLLGNFFGGIAIFSDKPFKIGDRVKIGTDADGFVREIGMRTTRIETFGGTMVILPNRKVADAVLENIATEKQRRMQMTIGVEYGTSVKKLDEAKKLIIKNIKAVEGLDHEAFNVAFNEFADSSLNIKVIYWITKEGMDRYWDVQDELLTGIKADFEKARIEFAFPTQTVYVKK